MWTKRLIGFAVLALAAAPAALAQGIFEGEEFQLNSGGETRMYTPALAFEPSGGFLAVWETYLDGLNVRFFDAEGRPTGDDRLLVAADPLGPIPSQGVYRFREDPAVTMTTSRHFLLFWSEKEEEISLDFFFKSTDLLAREVWGQRFDLAGRPTGQPFRLHEVDGKLHRRPAAASAGNGATLVVWEAEADGDAAVLGRLLDRRGRPLGEELRLDDGAGEAIQPAVASRRDGLSLVVWTDCCDAAGDEGIFGRLVDASGQTVSEAFAVNSTASGQQVEPAVAVIGDRFLVVWQGPTGELVDGRHEWRVYGRLVDAGGNLLGDEAMISGGLGRAHTSPVLAAGPGRALVAWMAWVGDFRVGVLGRRLAVGSDSLLPLGEALPFSQKVIDAQFRFGLASDTGGRAFAAWAGFGGKGERALLGRLLSTGAAGIEACSASSQGLQARRLSGSACGK